MVKQPFIMLFSYRCSLMFYSFFKYRYHALVESSLYHLAFYKRSTLALTLITRNLKRIFTFTKEKKKKAKVKIACSVCSAASPLQRQQEWYCQLLSKGTTLSIPASTAIALISVSICDLSQFIGCIC